jgi:hypothetical protein
MRAVRCGYRSEIGLILPVNILWGFSSPGLPDKKFFFVLAFSSAGCSRARASNLARVAASPPRDLLRAGSVATAESILFQARISARASVTVGSRFVARRVRPQRRPSGLIRPRTATHFRGVENVERVRQWRRRHPGYWRKKTTIRQATSALQDIALV